MLRTSVVVATDGSVDAVSTVRQLAALVGGGGGGTPELAVAGGRDASKVADVLEHARRQLGG